jgi:hypothetical protein
MAETEPGAGPDRKRYVITEDGVSEVETWLTEPVPAEPHLQTTLFVKVVLALMSGRPAQEYLDRSGPTTRSECASHGASNTPRAHRRAPG